jgi:inhibitor of cysteine peptidase
LFDISDRTNPQEISKYSLTDEYWSEAINNHHAFLQDPDTQIIFIPGGQTGNGYIMSYGDLQLSLTKIITGTVAERAVYLDNVLYILGQSKVIAVAEDTWETIKSVDLPHQNNQPIPYEY